MREDEFEAGWDWGWVWGWADDVTSHKDLCVSTYVQLQAHKCWSSCMYPLLCSLTPSPRSQNKWQRDVCPNWRVMYHKCWDIIEKKWTGIHWCHQSIQLRFEGLTDLILCNAILAIILLRDNPPCSTWFIASCVKGGDWLKIPQSAREMKIIYCNYLA